MYTQPRYNYPQRRLLIPQRVQLLASPQPSAEQRNRVLRELKQAGLGWPCLQSHEVKYLPSFMHPDEHIGGAVFGRHPDGWALLVATDRRVIFLDRKPFFTNAEELTFDVISGVSYGQAAYCATVTLHSRVKDYSIQTFNLPAARRFLEYMEWRCLEHKNERMNIAY